MTAKTERELMTLEHDYWQAMKDKDVAAVLRLTDDPCIVAGAQGVARVSKDQMAAMMHSASYSLKDFMLKDIGVRMLGDDVAIVAYNVREELTVNGQRVSFEAADASTWVRRGERWFCALHTESLRGDPFGRTQKPS